VLLQGFAYFRSLCNDCYICRLEMDDIRRIWKSADCVCLDVDSTVILDEGIDMLAEFFGKGAEVAKM